MCGTIKVSASPQPQCLVLCVDPHYKLALLSYRSKLELLQVRAAGNVEGWRADKQELAETPNHGT
jgi:hypothetical protein